MARLDVKYTAIDPYYSDQEQAFIGYNIDDCWSQKYDFDIFSMSHLHLYILQIK